MASVEWSELQVNGHTVSYAESGAGPGPDGRPRPLVLLVHGIASRGQQWQRVMAELGETCHVLAPDLLGHGRSAKPRGDYSLGAHACGLRDLLLALGHDRATVVGTRSAAASRCSSPTSSPSASSGSPSCAPAASGAR